jgi:hypothetical protein
MPLQLFMLAELWQAQWLSCCRHDPADLFSLTQIYRQVLQERLTATARTWCAHFVQ